MAPEPTPPAVRWRRNALSYVFWASMAALAVAPVLTVLANYDRDLPSLETLEGTLGPCGDDLCVGGTRVDFGPRSDLGELGSPHDFDGDGDHETMAGELEGLSGSEVRLEVESGAEDDLVRVVNGLSWRPLLDPAPWSETPITDDSALVAAPGPTHPLETPPTRTLEEAPASLAGLITVEGILTRCLGDWCVGDAALDFGPWWYLNSTGSAHDFDGDGTVESLSAELDGLATRQAMVRVEMDDGRAAYRLDGTAWRDLDAPPPWAGGPLQPAPPTPADPPTPAPEPEETDEPENSENPDEPEDPDDGPPTTIPNPSATVPGPPATGPPEGVPDGGAPSDDRP